MPWCRIARPLGRRVCHGDKNPEPARHISDTDPRPSRAQNRTGGRRRTALRESARAGGENAEAGSSGWLASTGQRAAAGECCRGINLTRGARPDLSATATKVAPPTRRCGQPSASVGPMPRGSLVVPAAADCFGPARAVAGDSRRGAGQLTADVDPDAREPGDAHRIDAGDQAWPAKPISRCHDPGTKSAASVPTRVDVRSIGR